MFAITHYFTSASTPATSSTISTPRNRTMLKPTARHAIALGLACLMASACAVSTAQDAPLKSTQAGKPIKNYAENPLAIELAAKLATEKKIPVERTLDILSQAEFIPSVVNAVRPPKTPTVKNWDVYRSRFVEPIRIRKGLKFWSENEVTLQDAERKFGVPQEVIVAIIGVETIYGEHIGNFRVLDALATLGFDYPQGQRDRSEFFRAELAAFIDLCENTHLDALIVKGSYAGAIGLGQFMPSSWQQFAVDGDENGIVDLFNSRRDAIFSVANFLKVHGWKPGAATLVPVEFREHVDLPTLLAPDILPTFLPETMTQLGLKLGKPVLTEEKLALVELVRGEKPSTYVVGGQNFYAVTRYNRSSFYATSVLQLAEELRSRRAQLANQAGKTPVDK
jgi:membrane-bound lytic murein transglycosylase B